MSTLADSDPLMSLAMCSADASPVSLSSLHPSDSSFYDYFQEHGDSEILPSDIVIDGDSGNLNPGELDDIDFNTTNNNNVTNLLGPDSPADPPSQINYRKRKGASNSTPTKSWVWAYFKKLENKKFCFCTLCNTEVNYGKSMSTGALARHIERSHTKVWQQHLSAKAEVSLGSSTIASTLSIDPFLLHCPKFESCLLKWMIGTYQPLRCVEDSNFRAMCQSLNRKAPILSRHKLKTLVSEEYHLMEIKLKRILKGRHYAFTTDGWSSNNHKAYVTCTVHFIDVATWKFHSMVMGLYEKDGGSKHEDIVSYAEAQLIQFDLTYSKAVAVVTDTEATMIAAGRLFVSRSHLNGGKTKWIGCIDHLVQLVTKLAFKGIILCCCL